MVADAFAGLQAHRVPEPISRYSAESENNLDVVPAFRVIALRN